MSYLRYVRHKIAYDSLPQLFLDFLGVTRIEICPFLLFQEGLIEGRIQRLETDCAPYRFGLFDRDNIKAIARLPERRIAEHVMLKKLDEGKLCYGLTDNEQVASFTWCDLYECNFPGYRFPLEPDEAYMFDAHTAKAFRGKGLAPWVRYQTYRELERLGKHRPYSVSGRFNTQAMRFKEKLNGRVIDEGVWVELFKRWHLRRIAGHSKSTRDRVMS